MTTYTVEFRYATYIVDADDSDMAVMKAANEAAEVVCEEDRGELLSITFDDQTHYTAAGQKEYTLGYTEEAVKLPSRRQGGLTLSYVDGDLVVCSFGYSASLCCAANEGELNHDTSCMREPKQLNEKQVKIVQNWLDHEEEFYTQNGWLTWEEMNG